VPDAIERIRTSWSLAAADPQRMSRAFYSNLFRLDPSTKPLFVGDMGLQGRKLAQTLTFIVDNIDAQDVLLPAAVDLARRHVGYGVTPDQYGSVGAALITTLQQLLGPNFTDDDMAAWVEAYDGLTTAMIGAAYSD
jgi:hemoglobin-like flavoprotein